MITFLLLIIHYGTSATIYSFFFFFFGSLFPMEIIILQHDFNGYLVRNYTDAVQYIYFLNVGHLGYFEFLILLCNPVVNILNPEFFQHI